MKIRNITRSCIKQHGKSKLNTAKRPIYETYANSADSDETPHNAASHQSSLFAEKMVKFGYSGKHKIYNIALLQHVL